MFKFIVAVLLFSAALGALQFYAYFNWYEKKPAGKKASKAVRVGEGVDVMVSEV